MSKIFMFLVLIVGLSPIQSFAQYVEREYIIAKINIEKENYNQEIKVPISSEVFDKNDNLIEGEFFAVLQMITHCSNCYLSQNVGFFSYAILKSNKFIRFFLGVEFSDKRCSLSKEIIFEKDKIFNGKSKCGIKYKVFHEDMLKEISK